MKKQLFRPFVFCFSMLIPLLILASPLIAIRGVYADDLIDRSYQLLAETSEDGQWVEMGTDSAYGGGISDNSGNSWDPSLAVSSDGTPIIAWGDFSNGQGEIYIRRWYGDSWVEMGSGSASGGGISNNIGESYKPYLAIDPENMPIVAWHDDTSGDFEIYVRRWNGLTWVEIGSDSASGGGISDNSGASYNPSLSIGPDGMPIVAWHDNSSGDYEIYVRRWNGLTWAEIGTDSATSGGISNNSGTSNNASLAIGPDGMPIVAWNDYTNADNELWELEVYVRRWDGTSWVEMGTGSASGGGISDSSASSFDPSLAIDHDGTPIIAWSEESGEGIYVLRWDGTSWVEMGAGSASGVGIFEWGQFASLKIAPDGTPMIACAAFLTSNYEIYALRLDKDSWVEVGSDSASGGSISENSGSSRAPSLAFGSDGAPIVAWHDQSSGDLEIYVRRWDPSPPDPRCSVPAEPFVDWSRCDKSSQDFSGAIMSFMNLTGTIFSDANLTDANLAFATATDAYFTGATMPKVTLYGADISGADFANANVSSADLRSATVENANFSGANLTNSNMTDAASFNNVNFAGATIPGLNLGNTIINNADFTNSVGSPMLDGTDINNSVCPDGTASRVSSPFCNWVPTAVSLSEITAVAGFSVWPLISTGFLLLGSISLIINRRFRKARR